MGMEKMAPERMAPKQKNASGNPEEPCKICGGHHDTSRCPRKKKTMDKAVSSPPDDADDLNQICALCQGFHKTEKCPKVLNENDKKIKYSKEFDRKILNKTDKNAPENKPPESF